MTSHFPNPPPHLHRHAHKHGPGHHDHADPGHDGSAQPPHSHDHAHSNDHSHHHDHAPTVSRANERKVLVSFFLIFTFMVVEVIGGVISGSLALLADAAHMFTDAAALALAYAAFRVGRRGADSRRTYGYVRFEVIASFTNTLTLFAIAGWLVYEAWRRLSAPNEILAGPMMGVAVLGLLVNALVLWVMTRGDTDHVNVKGAILHVMGDLLGSVGAILAAIIIYFTGWTPIDPILSVVVALLILRSAWKLMARSLHILLEGAPEDVSPEKIEQSLLETVPGLAAVGHIHVWQLTSGQIMATLHVRPEEDHQARAVSRKAAEVLKAQFNIGHATIAIDWNADDSQDDPAFCSLRDSPAQQLHHR